LYSHYKDDSRSIMRWMNKTFFDRYYNNYQVQRIIKDLVPELHFLNNCELKKVFFLFGKLIRIGKYRICIFIIKLS